MAIADHSTSLRLKSWIAFKVRFRSLSICTLKRHPRNIDSSDINVHVRYRIRPAAFVSSHLKKIQWRQFHWQPYTPCYNIMSFSILFSSIHSGTSCLLDISSVYRILFQTCTGFLKCFLANSNLDVTIKAECLHFKLILF